MERVPVIDRLYRQTLDLTIETRNYMAHHGARGFGIVDPAQQSLASVEALRITSRLTQALAWLMMQKAEEAGEVSQAQARDPAYAPDAPEICMDRRGEDMGFLPPSFHSLLERSHALYIQARNLHGLMTAEPTARPKVREGLRLV